jgi:hypothetical protein
MIYLNKGNFTSCFSSNTLPNVCLPRSGVRGAYELVLDKLCAVGDIVVYLGSAGSEKILRASSKAA